MTSFRLQRDHALSVLLVVQALTLFVAIPLGAIASYGRLLLDVSNLVFAVVAVVALTQHGAIQTVLFVFLALLALVPVIGPHIEDKVGVSPDALHEVIELVALGFTGLITALVARRVFGPGRVTAQRVQGAILLYLNVVSVFAIGYGLIEAHAPGAILKSDGGVISGFGIRVAELTYFSLTTITTTGFGDFLPVHPFARSLAGLEAVFGQLFPATLIARLVALHLVHSRQR